MIITYSVVDLDLVRVCPVLIHQELLSFSTSVGKHL